MTDKRSVGMVERMTLCQRVVHGVLVLAILMLVLSGLALAYHGHAWAHTLIAMMEASAAGPSSTGQAPSCSFSWPFTTCRPPWSPPVISGICTARFPGSAT